MSYFTKLHKLFDREIVYKNIIELKYLKSNEINTETKKKKAIEEASKTAAITSTSTRHGAALPFMPRRPQPSTTKAPARRAMCERRRAPWLARPR